jgi:hypothetical protein
MYDPFTIDAKIKEKFPAEKQDEIKRKVDELFSELTDGVDSTDEDENLVYLALAACDALVHYEKKLAEVDNYREVHVDNADE